MILTLLLVNIGNAEWVERGLAALPESTRRLISRTLRTLRTSPTARPTSPVRRPATVPVRLRAKARKIPGWQQDHLGRAEPAGHPMGDRAVHQRHRDHLARGLLLRLLDAVGHFVGLAVSPPHASPSVAHDNHGREAETATTFDHRRAPFDLDDAIDVFAV